MRNLKTHFEQVPIEVVRTILKQQAGLDEPVGQPPVDEQEPEESLFEEMVYPEKGRGERS